MTRHGIRRLVVMLAAGALLGAATPATGDPGHQAEVDVVDFEYRPRVAEIDAGAAVVWTWKADTHSVTSDATGAAAFSSHPDCPPVCGQTGDTYTLTFPQPGSYAYHCAVHPVMHGVVDVVPYVPPSSASPAPTPGPTRSPATSTPTSPAPGGSPAGTPAASGTPAATPGAIPPAGSASPSPSPSPSTTAAPAPAPAAEPPPPAPRSALPLAGLLLVGVVLADAARAWRRAVRPSRRPPPA